MSTTVDIALLTPGYFDSRDEALHDAARRRAAGAGLIVRVEPSPYRKWVVKAIPADVFLDFVEGGVEPLRSLGREKICA